MNFHPLVYNDDWRQELPLINSKEDLEEFISEHVALSFLLTGINRNNNEPCEQTIYVEDEDFLKGNKNITIKGNDVDILDNFDWGT
jgi:hypothetical protein